MFVSQSILQLMGVSEVSLQIAGGVILVLIALRMIFPANEDDAPEQLGEPLIVPLAIPAIAGPSAPATVLRLVSQAPVSRQFWPTTSGGGAISWSMAPNTLKPSRPFISM